jgi:hypothetical protein
MKAEFTKDENGTVRIIFYLAFRFGLFLPPTLVSDLARGKLIFSSQTTKSVKLISKIRKLCFNS